jgi:hypothetical protein
VARGLLRDVKKTFKSSGFQNFSKSNPGERAGRKLFWLMDSGGNQVFGRKATAFDLATTLDISQEFIPESQPRVVDKFSDLPGASLVK